MTIKKYLLLLFGLVFLSGCSTIYDVQIDYDESFNFNKAKNYSWVDLKSDSDKKAETINMVKASVDAYLKQKGMQISTSNPDLVIVPYVGVQQKSMETVEPGPEFRRQFAAPAYYGAPSTFEYEQGKLTLDFVDKKSNQLIWRGVAKADVDRVDTAEKKKQLIEKAVEKILKDFPHS